MIASLSDLDPAEISGVLDIPLFQGRQIFRWLHVKQVFSFPEMTDLSKALRERLTTGFRASHLRLQGVEKSPRTGTKKVLLELVDGETVESVYIRDRDRVTLCLSSQVGCALQCTFCATGLAGYRRNLSPGEIVEQALFLLAGEVLEGRTPNIVYMGMGEPFRNYDAVVKSIRLLMCKDGIGIGARRITVSTAGEIKEIARFAQEDWQVRLSVSLHAANDELRSQLVPLNRKYPLAKLREAIQQYQAATDRQITFEWTLLKGVNDRSEDAAELAEFMRGLKASVNLIPWNPVPGIAYEAPGRMRAEAFRDALLRKGLQATLRQEKGQDIEAACGQLRRIHSRAGQTAAGSA